ncbi:MAG: sensor histidine kinase [Clostridium sp.]
MKGKLVTHYFISFIIACTIIFIFNIGFMVNNLYNKGSLYSYEENTVVDQFENYIVLGENNIPKVNQQGIDKLNNESMGIQILDSGNKEVYSYNKPITALESYSNKDIINTYLNQDETMFLEETIINDNKYTYLLFMSPNTVNRIIYTYDVLSLREAHHFPVLIVINIILILILSCLFTVRISRPINRIIDKILDLSKGMYEERVAKGGIYYKIEERLNSLANRLKKNELERKKLEEMREEWICNITHDIKTPLTSIIGNAEILSDINYEVSDDLRVKKCNVIISKSEYIKNLVEDLNLTTRLKNNTIMLNKRRINLVSLVRHVIIDIINDENYSEKNIEFKYSSNEIYLELDERLIKRVFINLIVNAFIHNDDDVKVGINIEETLDGEIYITIKDNGKGVCEEDLDNIFKRYYRGTNTKKKIEGSGLGMAIAHDVILYHNGDINAYSELGDGLSIVIKLRF